MCVFLCVCVPDMLGTRKENQTTAYCESKRGKAFLKGKEHCMLWDKGSMHVGMLSQGAK